MSNRLQYPEAVTEEACDDQNRVANPSGSSEIVDNGTSGYSQRTGIAEVSAAVVDETFLRPISQSTPIRDLPCRRNCRYSISTGDDSNYDSESDDDEEDDLPVNDFFIVLFIILCILRLDPLPLFLPLRRLFLHIILSNSFQSRFVNETKYFMHRGR